MTVERRHLYVESPEKQGQTAYSLDFWILPRYALPAARISQGLLVLDAGPHPYYQNQRFEFIVVDLGSPLMILGLVVTLMFADWRAPFGMTLGAPADITSRCALIAVAPIPHADPIPSADYEDVPSGTLDRRTVTAGVQRRQSTAGRWGRRIDLDNANGRDPH